MPSVASLGKQCSPTLCYTSLQYFWMCEDEKGLLFWFLQSMVFRSGTETKSAKTIQNPRHWPAWQDEWQGGWTGQAVWEWLRRDWPAAWQGPPPAPPWERSPHPRDVSPGELRVPAHSKQREHPGQPRPEVSLGSGRHTRLSEVRGLQSPLSEVRRPGPGLRQARGDVWDSHQPRRQLPLLLLQRQAERAEAAGDRGGLPDRAEAAQAEDQDCVWPWQSANEHSGNQCQHPSNNG